MDSGRMDLMDNYAIGRHPFRMELPPAVLELSVAFEDAGFQLFVVGGAVRDAVMGVTPHDFDLATNATPDQVTNIIVSMVRYDLDEVGRSFGVIRARLREQFQRINELCEFEIATFRQDIGCGRRPDSVVFTTIEEDVKRRDLTINALFYDINTQEIVDLVGGLEAIFVRVIATVGDPHARFAEDRLRVLRAIRFASRFGYTIDMLTRQAIVHDNNLHGVSPERIRDEFIKSVTGAVSVPELLTMLTEFGMFEHIFPGLNVITAFDVLVSTRGVDTRCVPVLLSILLEGNDVELVARRLNELKYSDVEVRQVTFLMRLRTLSVENAFRLRKAFLNSQLTTEQLSIYFLERGMPDRTLMGAFALYLSSVPVGGNELLAQGYSGRALGMELERRETELFGRLLA